MPTQQKKRVVITGCGMITPLGSTVSSTWQRLLEGQSGIKLIDHIQGIEGIKPCVYGPVADYEASAHFSAPEIRKMDPFIQYGIVAAREAWHQAGIEVTQDNSRRIGVAVGSGIGGLHFIEKNYDVIQKRGMSRVSPFFLPGTLVNMIAGLISIEHNLKGPNISMVTACATGTHNIGYAARTIAWGDADVMVAGGCEKGSESLGIGGFAALKGLSSHPDPLTASRPWDKARNGFILSDGAGIMVLESLEHAQDRGANILAEVVGFGMSGDAHHATQPGNMGAFYNMKAACDDAGIDPQDIDHVNAHATSTPIGDRVEADTINAFFKEHACHVAVTANKSMMGHMLGATGAVEAIVTCLSIRDQVVPPTINCTDPEDDIAFDLVKDQSKNKRIRYALKNSFGFGGTNACLIFKQYEA